jgi:hypothetical protein
MRLHTVSVSLLETGESSLKELVVVYTSFYNEVALSPKELTAFRVAPELMEAMRKVKATKGVPIAVQLDFALRKWLKAQGVDVKEATSRPRRKRERKV